MSPLDKQRLAEAESALFLVGGYDGSGNYGDILQLASAIETAGGLPDSPLIVPIVERETIGYHRELTGRHEGVFGQAAFAFFQDSPEEAAEDDLIPVKPADMGAARSLVYAYGGGFLNAWWGDRKAAHVAAAEQLAGGRALPVVASGLQLDETAVSSGGAAHELLSRALWIGVRDADSLGHVRRQVPAAAGRVELAGDDALPFLRHLQTKAAPVVNLHLNDGGWIGDEPQSIRDGVVSLLRGLGEAADEPLKVQPVVAYEDPRVSERQIVSGLLEQLRSELEGAGLTVGEPLDVLEDALDNDLASFRRARLTVSCSYHVTLTSLLAGIPAVLLARNDYYSQKAAGLRDLFQLGPSRVGVAGGADSAPAAVDALVDGPPRVELVSHLRNESRRVAARFERGRAALRMALGAGLELSALELRLEQANRRAADAEGELAAVRATRGWRLLNRLRAARDMMR